jgi:uncharacterized protein (TIGR02145 family)
MFFKIDFTRSLRLIFFAFAFLLNHNAGAQDYLINFAGQGASGIVNSVKVENLTSGTDLILKNGETLRLIGVTGTAPIEKGKNSLLLYPNPVTQNNTILRVHPVEPGNALITIYDITGKAESRSQYYLENYPNEFRLSGLKNGLHFVSVTGSNYKYSGKLLCSGNSDGTIRIEKLNAFYPVDESSPRDENKTSESIVNMRYSNGDRLKFTGNSGDFRTVKTDVPEEDKTITFNFIPCTDGDNNKYSIVEIATQTWMAENLKTTAFNDGSPLKYAEPNMSSWDKDILSTYAWYQNDRQKNEDTYGALYNWYAIAGGNLCPSGWHIPERQEWIALRENLGDQIGSKIKETGDEHWTAGNILSTNETGFSALPGGYLANHEFAGMNLYGYFWGTDIRSGLKGSNGWNVSSDSEKLNESDIAYLNEGLSVRCVYGPAEISIPSILTREIMDISVDNASTGGIITSNGGTYLTDMGVCWSISKSPSIDDNKTSGEPGISGFSSSITGLEPGTTYNVRAYASNSAGTAYGNELTFTTKATIPVLSTRPAFSILRTSAAAGGSIISSGGASVTATGICWSTTSNPSIAASHTLGEINTGSFEDSITELTPGTIYYFRAYATNSAGTGYGNELSFITGSVVIPSLETTAISAITSESARSGGIIKDDGGADITERGICLATSSAPGLEDIVISNGTGSGSFTSILSGLEPGTTYHIRAFATNSAGTAFGNDLTFKAMAVVPVLTTSTVTSITRTTAKSGGIIVTDGGDSITASGICWSTSQDPSATGDHSAGSTANGSYEVTMENLLPNTLYYARAYAKNSMGTGYGNEVSFLTSQIQTATISTNSVSSVTSSTAISGGNITDDGGATVTIRGICWTLTSDPTIADQRIESGNGIGNFSIPITGLQPESTYYVRSYAINNEGTAYGPQVSFTTDAHPNTEVTFHSSENGSSLLHAVGDKSVLFKAIGSDLYLKYSSDNGLSYNQGVKVNGIFSYYNKARILSNGNIVLFTGSKIYYSDDNLTTINPCTVLDKDGSVYALHDPENDSYPGAYFNFMGGFAENDGVAVLGNYTNSSMGASPINLYYTLDGITWKVFYTFGQNPQFTDDGTRMGGLNGTLLGDPENPLITRHVHSVNTGGDGNFYACTGDDDLEIHFLKCSYDDISDSWEVNDLLTGERRDWQRMRALGVYERDGYLYWGSDGPGTFTYHGIRYDCFGIYKCAAEDINDPSKHILLQPLTDACYSFVNTGNLVIAGLQSYGYIYVSFDYGETWSYYAKPAWMINDTVQGVWFNDLYKYFVTNDGVKIESSLF